jgi:hypothetical protein
MPLGRVEYSSTLFFTSALEGLASRPGRTLPPEKDPVPIVQEVGWASGPVWTDAENLAPPGFDPQTVQPVGSRYTDYATLIDPISYFIVRYAKKNVYQTEN